MTARIYSVITWRQPLRGRMTVPVGVVLFTESGPRVQVADPLPAAVRDSVHVARLIRAVVDRVRSADLRGLIAIQALIEQHGSEVYLARAGGVVDAGTTEDVLVRLFEEHVTKQVIRMGEFEMETPFYTERCTGKRYVETERIVVHTLSNAIPIVRLREVDSGEVCAVTMERLAKQFQDSGAFGRPTSALAARQPIRHAFALSVDVHPFWLTYLTQEGDIFHPAYAGYWLRGVEHDPARGWLCYESLDKCAHGAEPDREAAIRAWGAREPLPAHWYRIDTETALRVWEEAVKRWGVGWRSNADARSEDVALQLALFGEVRYG